MPTLGAVVRTEGDHVSEEPGFQADSTQSLPPQAPDPRDLLAGGKHAGGHAARQGCPFSCRLQSHVHCPSAERWKRKREGPGLSAVPFVTQPCAVSMEISQAEPVLVTFQIQSIFHVLLLGCVWSASVAQKLHGAFLSISCGDSTLQFIQHCHMSNLTGSSQQHCQGGN